jgi:phosphate transport system protein
MTVTRLQFTQELSALDETLLTMGGSVRAMLSQAIRAYEEGDVLIAEQVLGQDDEIDAIEQEIETTSERLLALQQPMARDLRRVSSANHVASELERVGDHCVQIAKNARKLVQVCYQPVPLIDVSPMARHAERMLHDSLTAFIHHDVPLVRQVCDDDDLVDDHYKRLREELFSMTRSPNVSIAAASYSLLIVVSLERIADHASNIAERVAYIETGELQRYNRHREQLRK